MTLYGYDISSWQATLDPAVVPGDFVIVKATGGKDYLNPYCDRQIQAAKAAGKRVCVYHFVHDPGHEGTAAEEAQWFLDNTRGYQDGSVMFVMDWEADNVTDSAYALEFKHIFEAGADVRLVCYGSVSQLQYLKPCFDADSPLWVAAYTLGYQHIDGYNPPDGPLDVPSWATASMWQYTSQGVLPGYGGLLDLDVFYGDGAAWDALCAKLGTVQVDGAPAAPVSVPTPPPAPVTPPPAPAPAPAPAAGLPPYCFVDPGDTLGSIANQYGISLAELEAVNPGINYNLIYPGQRINLPGGAAPVPVAADPGLPPYCIVDPGDSMSAIAAQYGVSLQYLENVNPGINYDVIYPGQRINLR